MKQILDFLFGKKPSIFNTSSEVEHQLQHSRWRKWDAQYQQGKEYDWRRHEGMQFYSDSENKHP